MNYVEDFKNFVKERPTLVKHVNSGDMTWQKFYDQWALYGETEEVWEPYLKKEEPTVEPKQTTQSTSGFGLSDVMNMVKKIDSNTIQKNITSLQKTISLIQDFTTKGGSKTTATNTYNPRPMYKHFED